MEKFSPEIFREEEMSETVRGFPLLHEKSAKGLKKKML